MNRDKLERGIGGLGFLGILILIGSLGLIGMRIVPMYVDNFTIRSALKGLKDDPAVRGMSPAEIRESIGRRFDVNNVTSVGRRDLHIRRDGDATVVEVAYEVRRPLVGNLDVVARFNEIVVLPIR